jgi:hypothetical protein
MTQNYDMRGDVEPSVLRGAVAGAIGGLIGSFAMSEFQGWWSRVISGHEPRSSAGRHDARDWQEKNEGQNANEIVGDQVAALVLQRPPVGEERAISAAMVHYAFGAAMGAFYGVLAERERRPSLFSGGAFGTAVWAAADEIAIPMLGLSRSDVSYPVESHLQSWTAHVVYGVTTEISRRSLRAVI